MELNLKDYLYIDIINNKLKNENEKYEKIAEIKQKCSRLPQGYLTINK